MNKYIPLFLTLCLLLTACGGPTEESSAPAAPVVQTDPLTPHYSAYTVRSMRATITSGTDELEGMVGLNNLYQNQAAGLYDTLNTPAYRESYLSAPTGTPWISITFRPHSDTAGETYTVYENDLVRVEHPETGEQMYTAAAGTYYQTVTYLNTVRAAQTRHVTLTPLGEGGKGESAGYTIHYKSGRTKFYATGTDMPQIDFIGEGIVRVYFRGTYSFYDTVKGRSTTITAHVTDVAGDYVAAVKRDAILIYPLFSERVAARIHTVATAQQDSPVQGISFTDDGTGLHVVCRRGEVVWDRTLSVTDLIQEKVCYLLGDWQSAEAVSEWDQQQVGYNLLKKLRHKEKELGHTFSALPQKKLDLDGKVYYLTEIGYWEKVEGKNTYTVVGHLMVTEGIIAAYEATVTENELSWDMSKNWMKK